MEARGAARSAKKLRDQIWFKVIICVMTLLLVMCAALSAVAVVVCYGPSPTAGALFVARLTTPGPAGAPARVYAAFCNIADILVRLP